MTAIRGGSGVYEPRDAANHWPLRWKSDARSERLIRVELDCRCSVEFPEPAPQVGSAIYCRDHGPARVESADEPKC